jgi:Tfp pilus assembly protein PilO
MALSDNPKAGPLMGLVLAGLLGYAFYSGEGVSLVGIEGVPAKREQIQMMEDSIARLEAQTDSVKRDLASGTIDDLRKQIESKRATLTVLRQLVPERVEVPNLLDDIATRAKIRGVNVAAFTPPANPDSGPAPFNTYNHKFAVIGRYDQIGEFLSDIASLRRIIVPFEVVMRAAKPDQAKVLGDTTTAMLEANFMIKTYVKESAPNDPTKAPVQPAAIKGSRGGKND